MRYLYLGHEGTTKAKTWSPTSAPGTPDRKYNWSHENDNQEYTYLAARLNHLIIFDIHWKVGGNRCICGSRNSWSGHFWPLANFLAFLAIFRNKIMKIYDFWDNLMLILFCYCSVLFCYTNGSAGMVENVGKTVEISVISYFIPEIQRTSD